MWLIRELELRSTTYDFSSSEQGAFADTAVWADGIRLINMPGRVDWDEDPVQVEICEYCGTLRCQSGGFVSVRRLGSLVVLVPSLRCYGSSDPFERTEYGAPYFVRKRGAAAIEVGEWERVRSIGAALPEPGRIATLSWPEAFLAAQFEAANRLLGEPGASRGTPLSADVVATDPWVAPELLDQLGNRAYWTRVPGMPVLAEGGFERVSLITDAPFASTDIFVRQGGAFGLYFAPGLALLPGRS